MSFYLGIIAKKTAGVEVAAQTRREAVFFDLSDKFKTRYSNYFDFL